MLRLLGVVMLVLVLVLLGQSGQSLGQEAVKVTAYYETHCPDSRMFITRQLAPTFKSIGSIMSVDLVPYGKASYEKMANGSIKFQCQHGQKECTGNRIQACAISILGDTSSTLAFVDCMEKDWAPEMAAARCARENNINYTPIDSCAKSQQGDELLMQMGDRTHSLQPRLTFVPWININDQHSNDQQDMALMDLKGVVCAAYTGPRPAACDN